MMSDRTPAQLYAPLFGGVVLAVAVWGFVDGSSVLGIVPVNAADNVLHLGIATLGLAAGLASAPEPASPRAGMSAPSTR